MFSYGISLTVLLEYTNTVQLFLDLIVPENINFTIGMLATFYDNMKQFSIITLCNKCK